MAKKEYKFNPYTLSYEVIAAPFKIRFYRFLRKLLIGFILASIINFLFSYFFYTPKMYNLHRENSDLQLKYAVLQNKISVAHQRLNEIKLRDHNVYRPLFASDTMSIPGIYTPYDAEKYASFEGDVYHDLIYTTWSTLDALTREIYQESKSLDEVQSMSKDKELMATAIPAIWPINKGDLKGHIGAFGYRLHPVLGRYIMHEGIDLGGKKGSPIYATGNGRVVESGWTSGGYGYQVLIDHGFNYKTRYAHLSKIDVVLGQQVKRGEQIGEMGSTGRSTGSHLHYEVILKGKHVNPVNYFRRDMSEEEFQKIVESAKTTTFEPLDL